MSLSPSFSISQQYTTPSTVSIGDTSLGSDGAITQRHIYFIKADGTFLVPSGVGTQYVNFPFTSSSIDVNLLDRDYCLNIIVQWLDVSGNILYTKTILAAFTLYSELAYSGFMGMQIANNRLVSDGMYLANKVKLRLSIDDAIQAANIGGNINVSQAFLDDAKQLVDNKSIFF